MKTNSDPHSPLAGPAAATYAAADFVFVDRENAMHLEWSDQHSVDIVEVDAQHRRLFELHNAFAGAIAAGRDAARRVEALDALIAFSDHHAAAEERIMLLAGFTDLARHVQEHRRFAADLRNLREQGRAGRLALGPSVAGFVRDHLVAHVSVEDKPLYACLNPDQVAQVRRILEEKAPVSAPAAGS